METLTIKSSEKRIAINNDASRVIRFNPADITFAERFYQIINQFESKQAEYENRYETLNDGKADANGIPENIEQRLALINEVCSFMFERIDYVFGAGTSDIVFEGVKELDLITQFFDGIAPYVRAARSEKVSKYTVEKKKKAQPRKRTNKK